MTTVSDVLEQRLRMANHPPGLGATVSIAAHLAFFGFLVLISRPKPLPPVPLSVPIRIVSPGSVSARPRPASPRPAQALPQPEAPPAAPKTRPAIEKLKDEPAPSAEAMPLPTTKKEKPRPAPPSSAPEAPAPLAPAIELPAADSTGTGAESGPAVSFGASVASFDSDFPFAYYIEQLQTLIGANWLRPSAAEGTGCVVTFRIQRSGQVTDVSVQSPSGLPYFDRAATRALYAANPLPPLPPEYVRSNLGVHIRFQ